MAKTVDANSLKRIITKRMIDIIKVDDIEALQELKYYEGNNFSQKIFKIHISYLLEWHFLLKIFIFLEPKENNKEENDNESAVPLIRPQWLFHRRDTDGKYLIHHLIIHSAHKCFKVRFENKYFLHSHTLYFGSQLSGALKFLLYFPLIFYCVWSIFFKEFVYNIDKFS